MAKARRFGWWLVLLAVLAVGLVPSTRNDRREGDVVVATKKLDRHTVIAEADLVVAKRKGSQLDKAARKVAEVRDKWLLVAIDKNGVVHTTDVVSKDLVTGRVLVTLAVTASPDAPGVGERAVLILSPKVEEFVGVVIGDVGVVRVVKSDTATSYTVALLPADLEKVAPLIGVAEIRIAPEPRG